MFAVPRLVTLLGAGLVLVAGLCPSSVAAQEDEDISCMHVVSELNRRITRGQARGAAQIAKSLEIEPRRVEECLAIHGRRVPSRSATKLEPRKENPFRDAADANEPPGFVEFFEPADLR